MADDRAYRVLVHFDEKHERFYARVPELGIETSGETRSEALGTAETEIEQKYEAAATDDGQPLPPPVDLEEVEGEINISLSTPLARELKYHADRSKLSMDEMAQQLVVRAIGMLNVGLKPPPRPRPEKQKAADAERQEKEGNERGERNQERGGRKGRGRGRQGGRREGYRPEIEDQANFLAYVRDMEKGGGRRR